MVGAATNCPAGARLYYTVGQLPDLARCVALRHGRVVGTIGYVPVEEYLFFLLQPILTGLWLYWLLPRTSEPVQQECSQECDVWHVLWLSIAGAFMLQWGP